MEGTTTGFYHAAQGFLRREYFCLSLPHSGNTGVCHDPALLFYYPLTSYFVQLSKVQLSFLHPAPLTSLLISARSSDPRPFLKTLDCQLQESDYNTHKGQDSEMAQWVEMLAAKPGDPSSILSTPCWKEAAD